MKIKYILNALFIVFIIIVYPYNCANCNNTDKNTDRKNDIYELKEEIDEIYNHIINKKINNDSLITIDSLIEKEFKPYKNILEIAQWTIVIFASILTLFFSLAGLYIYSYIKRKKMYLIEQVKFANSEIKKIKESVDLIGIKKKIEIENIVSNALYEKIYSLAISLIDNFELIIPGNDDNKVNYNSALHHLSFLDKNNYMPIYVVRNISLCYFKLGDYILCLDFLKKLKKIVLEKNKGSLIAQIKKDIKVVEHLLKEN